MYPGKVSTKTAGLETIKIHWNNVLSALGAKWTGVDMYSMYLNTPLDRYEYMRIRLCDIPQEIIDEYNMNEIVAVDDYIRISSIRSPSSQGMRKGHWKGRILPITIPSRRLPRQNTTHLINARGR